MPTLADSVDELLVHAERREPFRNPDGRSSARFERVWIDGTAYVLKYVHLDDDFTMRLSGDVASRTARAWAAGLLDGAPDLIDHAIVGAALGLGRNGWGGALLMRDVSAELFPLGSDALTESEHEVLIDHLAGWCAATWDFHDDSSAGPGLLAYPCRWMWFGQLCLDCEEALGWPERVPRIAADGWERFAERVPPRLAGAVEELRRDVTPLTEALQSTPSCLLHGDPKASNTGIGRDGRLVLVDWAYVGEGPACHELGWHLALDREKLPVSKEATIELFRRGLEDHGIATDAWWERQLRLALLGTVVQFGWEKALGDADELGWWCAAAEDGLQLL